MPDKDPSLMARCLECDSRIYFERRPDVGQIIVCPECETSLEVIRSSPIRFDWADDGERGGSGASGSVDLDEFFRELSDESDEADEQSDDEDFGRY